MKKYSKKPTNKKWGPIKDHNTIEFFMEATKYGDKNERKTMGACKYTRLSKN